MFAGRILLTGLAVTTIVGTAAADLGSLHSLNPNWPPHARLHAIWSVMHVTATQLLAISLLWTGGPPTRLLRAHTAALLLLAFAVSFFVSAAIAPAFGATMTPDVSPADMPPRPLGWDGNLFSFVVAAPFVLGGW